MYLKRATVLLFLLAAIFSGCSTQNAWQYSAEPEASSPVLIDRPLVVRPFVDKRSNQNSNMAPMYMVPLLPYGWREMDTPEGAQSHMTSGTWTWRPKEDLAKAAAAELQASHLFKEVAFTDEEGEEEEEQLVLTGAIKSTIYEAKIFSYCLSVGGPALWFVGLPASHTRNALEVSFSLKDMQNEKLIWEGTYTDETSSTNWVYWMGSDFNYSDLYKKMLLRAVDDLRATLSKTSG